MKKSFLILLLACTAGLPVAYAQEANAGAATVKSVGGEELVTIKGTILADATSQPVAGVSVAVVGYPYSTMTDETGTFQLRVPASKECELTVKSPTQAGVIVALRGRDEITVRLMESGYKTMTNREVLTPLGYKESSHVASALSTVTSDNSLSVKGSPEMLLQGSVAGLDAQFRTGAEAAGANLILRGYNSLYASNQPLLVIDGMIIENRQFGLSLIEGQISTPLGSIDVKDIDQITVLKDATSIYGAKGANGAILIQTKRTVDLATHVDVTAYWGLNMQPKKLPMLGAADSKRYLSEVATTSGLSASQVSALDWVNASLPARQPDGTYEHANYYKYNNSTDWQDEIFQTGFKQQYSLNVSGGDETAVYGVSMGFQNKDGLIEGTDYQRFNARLNAAIKFTDRIHFNANMSFVYGEKNVANEGSASEVNPLYTALVKAPFTSPYSISETNIASPAYEAVDALGAANPTVVVNDLKSQASFYRFLGSYAIDIDLAKDWKLNSTFGLDFNKEREEIFYPTSGIPYANLSSAEVTNQQMHRVERLFNLYNDTHVSYAKNFGLSSLDASVGLHYLHCTAEDDYGHGYNSASNYYQTLSAGDASLYQNGGALGNWNWLAFYGNVDLNFLQRYFLEATVSSDASSRYGDNIPPLQVYYGVNAAWLISSERWGNQIDWINHLKLRAGVNTTGNDDIGNYNSKQYYTSTPFLSNNGLVLGALMNEDLKPERVTKWNLGLDFSALHERLNLSVDLYHSTTKNMLIYSTASSFTGFANYISNGGEMQNTGVEVALSGRILNKKHFSWDIDANMAHNRNRINDLSSGAIETSIGDGVVLTQVGSAAGVFYGYKTNGVYATTAEAEADGLSTMVGSVKTAFAAGDVRFVNVDDSNDIIDSNDRVQIGDPNPDLFGGFSSTMKSHGFTLTAQFNYSVGNDIYNYTRSQLESMSTYANQTKAVLNRWRTEGDITCMPRAQYGDPMGNNRFSDRWIEDGSYLKFKSLTLAYDVPLKSNVLTGLTVYGTVENLYTWTDYKGYDPEIISSSSNNPLYHGVDAFTTPTTRTFYIGLKLGL
jgi:TonB-linked SusC/RagA family outer membrane protein